MLVKTNFPARTNRKEMRVKGRMKLLASVINEEEARAAILGGAHIIDVKNPEEGSLGANFPHIINKVSSLRTRLECSFEISAAVGDAPNLPGTIALACVGAAAAGADYVKVGLFGVKTESQAVYMMRQAKRGLQELGFSTKLVVAGYADAENVGAVPPVLIPEIGHLSDCDVAMLDTAEKKKRGLFNFLSIRELQTFVEKAHEYGLKTALAGSLRVEDILKLREIGVDIVGVRGSLCDGGERTAKLKPEKVRELLALVESSETIVYAF